MERIEELEQWLEEHEGDTLYGGWRGDEPNEAWRKLKEYKELMKRGWLEELTNDKT